MNISAIFTFMGYALVFVLILAVLGESQLLTPSNLFLYELIWMIPGFLITEWTRSL